jgi:hypothetical protein
MKWRFHSQNNSDSILVFFFRMGMYLVVLCVTGSSSVFPMKNQHWRKMKKVTFTAYTRVTFCPLSHDEMAATRRLPFCVMTLWVRYTTVCEASSILKALECINLFSSTVSQHIRNRTHNDFAEYGDSSQWR